MTQNFLELERLGNTAIVRINRPQKLNALNLRILNALRDLFDYLGNDTEIYTIILTGTGTKAFAAGADISELNLLDASTASGYSREGQNVLNLIDNLNKPVIAAVNGFALGGGFELALACHIRIAAENARFGFPETGLGIIPGFGGTQRLSRIMGMGRSLDYILTGDLINANEALQSGIVSRVCPHSGLLELAKEIAIKIGNKSQIAVNQALKTIKGGIELPMSEALELEFNSFTYCCATDDFKEGTSAFLEKRDPNFRNH